MSDSEIDTSTIPAQVEVLKLEPGDLLMVKVGKDYMGEGLPPWIPRREDLREVAEDIEPIVPEGVKVFVSHLGVEYEIVRGIENATGVQVTSPASDAQADDEDLGSDLRFWTTLLRLSSSNKSVLAVLQANCTHVIGPYWIMEGDTDYLRDEGVRFTEVAEGAVPTLGGRSVAELCQICRDSFDVDVARGYAQADHRDRGRPSDRACLEMLSKSEAVPCP